MFISTSHRAGGRLVSPTPTCCILGRKTVKTRSREPILIRNRVGRNVYGRASDLLLTTTSRLEINVLLTKEKVKLELTANGTTQFVKKKTQVGADTHAAFSVCVPQTFSVVSLNVCELEQRRRTGGSREPCLESSPPPFRLDFLYV